MGNEKILTRESGAMFLSLFGRWQSMIARCYSKGCREYKNYGGRGITVCDEWRGRPEGFLNYVEYVSQLEHFGEKNYSLDRIDVNGNYEPGNLRWASYRQQAKNRRRSVVVDGKSLNELSEETGIAISTLSRRWHRGERGEQLLRPSCPNLPVTDGGQTLREIAAETGHSLKTIKDRWRRGWRGDDLRK